jgi:hypothetical protein
VPAGGGGGGGGGGGAAAPAPPAKEEAKPVGHTVVLMLSAAPAPAGRGSVAEPAPANEAANWRAGSAGGTAPAATPSGRRRAAC